MNSEFKQKTDELLASIQHQIDWLSEIQKQITAGTYTPSQAENDYSDAVFNEGFDWLSLLVEIAEMEYA
jgi:hypothetical protein